MSQLLTFIPSVVIIIVLGWLLRRTSFLKREDVHVINQIIIYIALPSLIFLAVYQADISFAFIKLPLLNILIMSICMLLALAVGKTLKQASPLLGAFIIVAAIGNTGYLGFPLTLGLYGQENLVKAVFYDFGTVVYLFSIGIIVAKRFGDGAETGSVLREFILFPSTIALAAGLALHFISLPEFIVMTLDYLSLATIPLVMLTIGLTLEAHTIKKYILPLALVALIRLIVSPVIGLSVGTIVGYSGIDLGIIVLEASMPVAMLSLVIGLKYELEVEFISAAILVSIIASLVSIPLFQAILTIV